MNAPLLDQSARDEALDVSRSFIVQAPAGSGKTGLLTLRYLRLLSISEQPEQVLAITFTRKAASEMRQRILHSLHWATEWDPTQLSSLNSFEQKQLEISKQVLSRDKELHWGLLENPTRMRVQTIDSFCFYLASQLPILSRIGGNPIISEDVELCFRDAINSTLSKLESNDAISSDIEKILVHLDNDISRVERLLIDLLKRREQWLSYVLEIGQDNTDAKEYLQNCLEELINESLIESRSMLEAYSEEIIQLLNFAASNLAQSDSSKHENSNEYSEINELPQTNKNGLQNWNLIADLFLTKTGSWRKTIDKRMGFPTGNEGDNELKDQCKQMKARWSELKDCLSTDQDLLHSLNYLRILPNTDIDEAQWNFLTALSRVLSSLSSELLISFRRFKIIDYTETSVAARSALGSAELPTDLALALDHSIHHILVDEFQDTSQLQLDLLKQLTAGWESEGQRSLFLVGDAMQSCYGFRNANVGIYLNVQEHGIGNINIQPIQLQANFRSEAGIVDWVNRHFSTAFPLHANPSRGAVTYASSTAVIPVISENPVTTDIISYEPEQRNEARELEALRVVEHIQSIQSQNSEGSSGDSIAVLVRSRNHLEQIITALRHYDIPWSSTDIDRMGAEQIAEDLLSLSKALLNPFDKLSWLSVLRAPWLGLTISDLLLISQQADKQSIWSVISNPAKTILLSEDAKNRLENFTERLAIGMKFRFRIPLRELVERTWELIGGALTIRNERELACTQLFFNLLEEQETAGGLTNIAAFKETLFSAFIPSIGESTAEPDGNSQHPKIPPVQLLTMHKAKGLEFDHVIIPALANRPRSDDKALFLWHERINQEAQSRLFVASLTATGSEDDGLYKLLRYEKKTKLLLENTRLLYIAITRARKSAKLLATVALNSKQEMQVPELSLLNQIWTELNREADSLNVTSVEALCREQQNQSPINFGISNETQLPTPTPIFRLQEVQGLTDSDHARITSYSTEPLKTDIEALDKEKKTQNTSDFHGNIGELIHEALEDYTASDEQSKFIDNLGNRREYWKLKLRNLAVSEKELEEALEFILESIKNTVTNPEFDWIFNNNANDSHSEFPVSSLANGKIQTHVIDRTLVDSEGVRWIIDYKTGVPAQEEKENDEVKLSQFIAEQLQLHQAQLHRYKKLYEKLESRQSKTAILFTAIPRLVEIS